MKTKTLVTVALASFLGFGVGVCGAVAPQVLAVAPVAQNQFTSVAFNDSAEAGMMRRAYKILETGNHDYKGHRVKAMKQIKAAADALGLDLRGGDKDKEPQPLSDAKLREAQGLLEKVLGAAEVKSQEHISKHVSEAIKEINKALAVR